MLAKKYRRTARFLAPWHFVYFFLMALSLSLTAVAQDPASDNGSSKPADVVLAKLGKQEILLSELSHQWRLASVKVAAFADLDPLAIVEGVEAIRKQRIAQAELDRRGLGATTKEVEQWIERRLDGIEGEKLTAADLAAKEKLSLSSWQNKLRWQLSWERYTEPLISAEKLRSHYDSHKEWFDGTEHEVFHVIRPLKWNDRSGRDKAVAELSDVATKIRNQELTFEEAAKKWSSGATAEQGGRLGWMTYQGPMHPSFNRAVFGLKENEVGEPIETPHGVHLIWIKAIKPGELPFDRVVENVRRSLLVEEFDKLVNSYAKSPKLEWVYPIENHGR